MLCSETPDRVAKDPLFVMFLEVIYIKEKKNKK